MKKMILTLTVMATFLLRGCSDETEKHAIQQQYQPTSQTSVEAVQQPQEVHYHNDSGSATSGVNDMVTGALVGMAVSGMMNSNDSNGYDKRPQTVVNKTYVQSPSGPTNGAPTPLKSAQTTSSPTTTKVEKAAYRTKTTQVPKHSAEQVKYRTNKVSGYKPSAPPEIRVPKGAIMMNFKGTL